MDLKRLLNDYQAVKKEFEDAKKKPEILREKAESLRKLLAELESVIETASKNKNEALVNFAAGDISEADVRMARENLNNVMRQKIECQEFLEASEKANRKIQETITNLSQKLNGRRHEFWNVVAAELKSKITSDIIERVYVVYASRSLAGGVGSYEGFLRELFPLLPLDENQRVQKELVEKFGFTE